MTEIREGDPVRLLTQDPEWRGSTGRVIEIGRDYSEVPEHYLIATDVARAVIRTNRDGLEKL